MEKPYNGPRSDDTDAPFPADPTDRRLVTLAPEDNVCVGFPGCYPNAYPLRMMKRLCTHPNVGGILLLSLGCEGSAFQ